MTDVSKLVCRSCESRADNLRRCTCCHELVCEACRCQYCAPEGSRTWKIHCDDCDPSMRPRSFKCQTEIDIEEEHKGDDKE